MEIRELEIFLAVADLLHFGRASQVCNLSPSALTRTIQRLEDEVGEPLFLRDNRTVTLSVAGERFREYARQAVKEWEDFRMTVRGGETVGGSLSIYASITAVYSILPDLLESYRMAYPDVQFELRTGAAEEAVPLVDSGVVDLAVAALPDRHATRIEFLPIVTTPLLFIAPRKEGPFSFGGGEDPDLARAPLVLPQSGLSRRRLDKWLREEQIRPNITSEVSGNEAIIAMVRLGCGIGVVPQLVLERSPFRDEISVLERAPQLDPYVVSLCASRRNLRRPSVAAFWRLAEASSSCRGGEGG